MNKPSINTKSYSLEYLRDRRAKIDALIKAIEEFDDDGSSRDSGVGDDSNRTLEAVVIAPGIYTDMTIAAAAMHFIKSSGKPQGTSEIVKALRKGGIGSTSKNLYRTVYNSLNTKIDKGAITKSHGKWGLKEGQEQ